MVAPAVEGIDLFKIAGRSISGWIPSFKTGTAFHVRQPFCSQLEERLLLWLEYHPQVARYARGDIGPQFATTYRLPAPSDAPFAIGYTFEGKPHDDNTIEISAALNALAKEGCIPTLDELATLSPYQTRHIKRFGNYEIDLSTVPALIADDLTFPLEPPAPPEVVEAQ